MLPQSLNLTKFPVAIFFAAQDFGDKLTLSTRLRDSAEGIFDGEALVLPVPENARPELPRIQLQASDNSAVLQLSNVRLAVEWSNRTGGPVQWNQVMPDYLASLAGLLRVFVGEYAKPLRFALSPQIIFELDSSANEYLARNILQSGRILRTPHDIKLGFMDRIELAGLPAHFAMNVASARRKDDPERDSAIVLQFEVRSQALPEASFGADQIMGVARGLEAEIERRVRAFLPEFFTED